MPSGNPSSLYDDHLTLLTRQPYFFARKIAPAAHRLRSALLEQGVSPPDRKNVVTSVPSPPDREEIFGNKTGLAVWPHLRTQFRYPELDKEPEGYAQALWRSLWPP